MATTTTSIEEVWDAKGNLASNAIVATAAGKYPALDGSLITNLSSGDLLAANNLSELTATASTARTNLELGASDTVEFGAIVPPSGTTAEIDAVFGGALAVPDALYFDRDKQQMWQALTSSTRQLIGAPVSDGSCYYIDGVNGVDSTGASNNQSLPFKTITAAFDAWEADATVGDVTFYINTGNYDEVDVMQNVTAHGGDTVTIVCGTSVYFSSTSVGTIFDNSAAVCLFAGILGFPIISSLNKSPLYSGAGWLSTSGTFARFEIGSLAVNESYSSMINITSDNAFIRVNSVKLGPGTQTGFAVVTASGAVVSLSIPSMSTGADYDASMLQLDGASHGTLSDSTTLRCQFAHMVDAASVLVLKPCGQSVPAFPPVTVPCITAAVATTNVYIQGTSGAGQATDANVTEDNTFGAIIVNAASENLYIRQ